MSVFIIQTFSVAKGLKLQSKFPFWQEAQQAIKIYEILSLWSEKKNAHYKYYVYLIGLLDKQKMQISKVTLKKINNICASTCYT